MFIPPIPVRTLGEALLALGAGVMVLVVMWLLIGFVTVILR